MGLYSGGAYIWNEVSVSTCGGLIHGGGGLYSGGGYSRRFTVCTVISNSRGNSGVEWIPSFTSNENVFTIA